MNEQNLNIVIKIARKTFSERKTITLKLYRKLKFSSELKVIEIIFSPILGENIEKENKLSILGVNVSIAGIILDKIYFENQPLFILDRNWFYNLIQKAIKPHTKIYNEQQLILNEYLNESYLLSTKNFDTLRKKTEFNLKNSWWNFDDSIYKDVYINLVLLPSSFKNKSTKYTIEIHRCVYSWRKKTIVIEFSPKFFNGKLLHINIKVSKNYTEYRDEKFFTYQESHKIIDTLSFDNHSTSYIINKNTLVELIYKILPKYYSHDEKLEKIEEYIKYSAKFLNGIYSIHDLENRNLQARIELLESMKDPSISSIFERYSTFIQKKKIKNINSSIKGEHDVKCHWRTSILGNTHWVRSHKRG